MTSAREEILKRIREALADPPTTADSDRDARDDAGDHDGDGVPRAYRRSLPAEVDIPALFAERVADYRATVRRVPRADLPAAIAAARTEFGLRRIVVPPDLPAAWLPADPPPADRRREGTAGKVVRDDGSLGPDALDRLDGVLTGCAVGIAETGTIVLDGGVAQGRRALSLVPDCHLCVVRVDQVVGTVAEGVSRLDPARPHTWISGPSATSDIELNRVEGVHGPRTLVVLLVEH